MHRLLARSATATAPHFYSIDYFKEDAATEATAEMMQKELSKYTFYLSQVSITLHVECQTSTSFFGQTFQE